MASSRPVRVRPTLNVKMDVDGPPELKRRKVLGNIVPGVNGNGSGNGAATRSGNGPRTRGMVESNLASVVDDGSNTVAEEGNIAEAEATRRESSSESSCSESSDSSDSEDSSDMSEGECERKRSDALQSMTECEKIFEYQKELVYRERAIQADVKFEQVKAGTAMEFIKQLELLQENMKTRVEIAAALRDLRIENLENVVEAEYISAKQTLENDKQLLRDSIKLSIDEKINRLEQDRNNDFSSELWMGTVKRKISTSSKDIFGERKKKPAIVTGPYIVYMLHDVDIMEDWTAIKKAAIAPRRKPFVADTVLAY